MRFFLLSVCLGLTACATKSDGLFEKPLATSMSGTERELRSAKHWGVIADDVVEQTTESLKRTNIPLTRPLYVVLKANSSNFDSTYRDFLISQFLKRGVTVAARPEGALAVEYETRVLYYPTPQAKPIRTGAYTALAAGVLVWRRIVFNHMGLDTVLGLALGLDAANATKPNEPNAAELVVTTRIIEEARYLTSNTDSYYIPSFDAWHYTPPKEQRAWGVK